MTMITTQEQLVQAFKDFLGEIKPEFGENHDRAPCHTIEAAVVLDPTGLDQCWWDWLDSQVESGHVCNDLGQLDWKDLV